MASTPVRVFEEETSWRESRLTPSVREHARLLRGTRVLGKKKYTHLVVLEGAATSPQGEGRLGVSPT